MNARKSTHEQMTAAEAYEILKRGQTDSYFDTPEKFCEAYDMAMKSIKHLDKYKKEAQQFKRKYLACREYCEWTAREIFDESWKDNKGSFAEIACRKLNKLGLVKAEGSAWVYREKVSE